jgi:hypothetical protein
MDLSSIRVFVTDGSRCKTLAAMCATIPGHTGQETNPLLKYTGCSKMVLAGVPREVLEILSQERPDPDASCISGYRFRIGHATESDHLETADVW